MSAELDKLNIKSYKDMLHQMMCDTHNVGIEVKDKKHREILMGVAQKLAILCDICNDKNNNTEI